MALRRKRAKAPKAGSETQEQPKSRNKEDSNSSKKNENSSIEALVIDNGNLIESLLYHPGWMIVEDLIDEGIASVSGRKTNGYYYSGSLTNGNKDKNYLTGYQDALVQLYNRTKDFIRFRDKLMTQRKKESSTVNDPIINPFMESDL